MTISDLVAAVVGWALRQNEPALSVCPPGERKSLERKLPVGLLSSIRWVRERQDGSSEVFYQGDLVEKGGVKNIFTARRYVVKGDSIERRSDCIWAETQP